MSLRIYPPIGIARLGNHPDRFYIGPESPWHPGNDVDAAGIETTVTEYKVGDELVKRQAARFRLFEGDAGASVPAVLPPGTIVEWTVHLVNRKGAVARPERPPPVPTRPQHVAGSAELIDPGPRTVSGAGAAPQRFDTGTFLGRPVPLGEIRTDANQNLLVLGGFGFSSSPTGAGFDGFYSSPGWHDDTADGYVKAVVRYPDGTVDQNVAGAWVVVGPPDYAPEIQGVVTLFDVIAGMAHASLGLPVPGQVSFTRDVFPMIFRARRLRWVNPAPNWMLIGDDWTSFNDPSAASAALRAETAEQVRETEGIISSLRLTSHQRAVLSAWEAGNFVNDWNGLPQPGPITAEGLTRAALDGTVGQGFFPGIEGGIILTDTGIWQQPFDFRLDHAQLSPGDVTALMAQPWQADFAACDDNWWPSQRPNEVRTDPNVAATRSWARGATSYAAMVANFGKLAFITAHRDSQGNVVFSEAQRAPEGSFAP